MVELQSDEILRDADKEDVSLLVVGDPFGYVSLGLQQHDSDMRFSEPVRRLIAICSSAHELSVSQRASYTTPL